MSTRMLLLSAVRTLWPRLTSALHGAGYTDVHPRHGAVLTHLDPKGTPVALLASRAGLGKAAMGALVDELERAQYVQRKPSAPGRLPLIVATLRGQAVIRLMMVFDRQMEQHIQRAVGPNGYESLRTMLHVLARSLGGTCEGQLTTHPASSDRAQDI